MYELSYESINLDDLVKEKKRKGLSVGVCISCRNEEDTLGEAIDLVREKNRGLVDNVMVFDSGSTDGSEDICNEKNVRFIKDTDFAREIGLNDSQWRRGKGFNMWAALQTLPTDIVSYLDSDLINPHPSYVYGPVAPLVYNDDVQFSKGGFLLPETDNRATRITAEPMINLLFPEINEYYDPLSGMFAGRRDFLKKFEYPSGYGVELHLLVETFLEAGTEGVAQVFLGNVTNGNRDNSHYGRMASALNYIMMTAAERHGRLSINHDMVKPRLKQHIPNCKGYSSKEIDVSEIMLPSYSVS